MKANGFLHTAPPVSGGPCEKGFLHTAPPVSGGPCGKGLSPEPPALTDGSSNQVLDVPFHVPFTHRVRFTNDITSTDEQVLLDLLHTADGGRAKVQLWVDSAVADAQPEAFVRLEQMLFKHADLTGPAFRTSGGETVKNDRHCIMQMLDAFDKSNLDRHSYVIVVGGGAVLDAVGFAVAIAHRGLRLIRLPTTTVGQGDSGVGVKNGINMFGKKNWLGAFAVPWAVINDLSLLRSLPDRDWLCGFAEAVKVTLLKDRKSFEHLCDHTAAVRNRDMTIAGPILRRSCELHLAHITKGGDPFEMREARPLDFGHWSAHKLEAMTNFSVRHGEAVAIGLAIDVIYSSLEHGLPEADAQRILQCLQELGLPLTHPALADSSTLIAGLEEFRQHLGGRLTVTMLSGIGKPVDVHSINQASMREALRQVVPASPPVA